MSQQEQTIANKQRYANDISVERMEIVSYNGDKIDITAMVAMVDIYESIEDCFLSGSLFVADAVGLAERFPIVGMELLNISFRSPLFPESVHKTFRIYKISDRVHQANDNVQMYHLNFMSPEAFRCLQVKVSRAYTGFHHEIVGDIFTDYIKLLNDNDGASPDRILTLDPARDSERIIFPGCNPGKCIQMAVMRSRSAENPQDRSFVFYQNLDGFHFKTISSMYSQNPSFEYRRRITNVADAETGLRDMAMAMYTIEEMTLKSTFNRSEDLRYGKVASQIYGYDPLRREMISGRYDYISDFSQNQHAEPFPTVPLGVRTDILGAYGSNVRWVPVASDRDPECPMEIDIETGGPRNAQMKQHFSNLIQLAVPGNSRLRAGQMVQINIPSMSSQNPKDSILSGKYLIHSIRHSISENREYKCFLTVARDSIPARLPDIKEPTRFDSSQNGIA